MMIYFNNHKKWLAILFTIIFSFIFTGIIIKSLFLANSPRINPFFAQNLTAKVNSFLSKTRNFFAFKTVLPPTNNQVNQVNFSQKPTNQTFTLKEAPKEIIEALNVPLTKVSQGVYAGEKNNIKVYEIRTNEIEYLQYTFNVNGKEIKIKVPKGQEPPSQEVVGKLYQ